VGKESVTLGNNCKGGQVDGVMRGKRIGSVFYRLVAGGGKLTDRKERGGIAKLEGAGAMPHTCLLLQII